MLGYIILFLAIVVCTTCIKNINKRTISLFFVVTIFSAIRHGIGYDFYAYEMIAKNLIGIERMELIPAYLLEFANKTHPQVFFVTSSVFISTFYCLGILSLKKEDQFTSFLTYLCFPFLFIDQLGIIRQGMATAVVFYAICRFIDNKKIFILLVALAYLCHRSSVFALFLLVPWNKMSHRILFVIYVASFIIGEYIIGFLFDLFLGSSNFISDGFYHYMEDKESSEGTKIRFIWMTLAVITLIKYKRLVTYDNNMLHFVNIFIIGACVYNIFLIDDSIAKRLSMFFMCSIVTIMPSLIKALRIPRQIYYSVCLILFVLLVYFGSNNKRDEDQSGYYVTYPYRTF
ncbi:EpsG family protein [Bacteroides bouchesdurhonensis]